MQIGKFSIRKSTISGYSVIDTHNGNSGYYELLTIYFDGQSVCMNKKDCGKEQFAELSNYLSDK